MERLIGTIRREYLDYLPFWNARDLDRKLDAFKGYYNQQRTHQGLNGKSPDPNLDIKDQAPAKLGKYRWMSYCRGLYQLPIAV